MQLGWKKKEKKINPRFAHLYTEAEGGTAKTEEEALANQKIEEENKAKAKADKKKQQQPQQQQTRLPAETANTQPTDEANETFVEATRVGLEQTQIKQ